MEHSILSLRMAHIFSAITLPPKFLDFFMETENSDAITEGIFWKKNPDCTPNSVFRIRKKAYMKVL